ncbi:hypothetical protein HIM_10115 [Hirsutella minnesotensis 3608]|uniref:non-specific serine/threonine protein kinase n=1 Tax=Hirsutella minnesotensis 3608 TaxID=1043627 RepID=A0A0F7ZG92_9HYPO|nr:hypothetical protein HIM_10115 [Hirsutella minnesotensis 3608]
MASVSNAVTHSPWNLQTRAVVSATTCYKYIDQSASPERYFQALFFRPFSSSSLESFLSSAPHALLFKLFSPSSPLQALFLNLFSSSPQALLLKLSTSSSLPQALLKHSSTSSLLQAFLIYLTYAAMPYTPDDQNVFVVLTACDTRNKASSAFKLQHNSKWLRSVTIKADMDNQKGLGRIVNYRLLKEERKKKRNYRKEEAVYIHNGSREVTPASGDTESEDDEPNAADRLVVTFDKLGHCPNGLQFGTRPSTSHILLGHRGTKGISARQYNIVADSDLRIWLHDYSSSHGTAVGYDGQNQEETRKKEKWILAFSPGTKNYCPEISIHSGGLAIIVEFPNHEAARPQYVESLKTFFNQHGASTLSGNNVPTIVELELESTVTTQAPSGEQTPSEGQTPSKAQTPSQRLIYYTGKTLGSGAYGTVYRAIRARDGCVVAAKTFARPSNKRNLDEVDPAWLTGIRREFAIMRDNPHANVLQVFDFQETPQPTIIMAYYPCGNIADASILSDERYVSALGQILDGLSHLHAQGTVHRDLKPENILIEREPLFKVAIADFGLAKVIGTASLLTTFCGTLLYAAPEVFPGISDGHGPTADIWSLGVIGLEWLYNIPTAPKAPRSKAKHRAPPDRAWHHWIKEWSDRLIAKLKDEDDDKVIDILSRMLKFEATDRWSAKRCLEQGFRNGLFSRRPADNMVICADDSIELSRDNSARFLRSEALSPTQHCREQEISETTVRI